MPKDDWAKYARRDRGRKALASGNYFRAGDGETVKRQKKRKKRFRKCKRRIRQNDFVIVYSGRTPEQSILRVVKSGPLHLGIPPWPGFP